MFRVDKSYAYIRTRLGASYSVYWKQLKEDKVSLYLFPLNRHKPVGAKEGLVIQTTESRAPAREFILCIQQIIKCNIDLHNICRNLMLNKI